MVILVDNDKINNYTTAPKDIVSLDFSSTMHIVLRKFLLYNMW